MYGDFNFLLRASIFQNFHNSHCFFKGRLRMPLHTLQECDQTLNLSYVC